MVSANMTSSVYLAVYRIKKATNLNLIMGAVCQSHVENQPMRWFQPEGIVYL